VLKQTGFTGFFQTIVISFHVFCFYIQSKIDKNHYYKNVDYQSYPKFFVWVFYQNISENTHSITKIVSMNSTTLADLMLYFSYCFHSFPSVRCFCASQFRCFLLKFSIFLSNNFLQTCQPLPKF
jgi:hypothetical protein